MAPPKKQKPVIDKKKHPLKKFSTTARMLVEMELEQLDPDKLSILAFKQAIRRVVDRIQIARDDVRLEQCQRRFTGLQKDFESVEKFTDETERGYAFDSIRKKIDMINVERRDALADMTDVYSNFVSLVARALEVAEHSVITDSPEFKSKYIEILKRNQRAVTEGGRLAAGALKDVKETLGAEKPAAAVTPEITPAPEPLTGKRKRAGGDGEGKGAKKPKPDSKK